ncbi:AbrB/MazE/SpoVT family DNA-binding domain-containing protein [soil metagenome]
MKITTKGQVTIPRHIREELGLLPHTEVDFEILDGWVRLRKAGGGDRRGRRLVERIRGRADTGMSTDEILALTRGEGPSR